MGDVTLPRPISLIKSIDRILNSSTVMFLSNDGSGKILIAKEDIRTLDDRHLEARLKG